MMKLPPIKVHVGEIFELSVPSNPGSTGFACTLGKMPECVYLVSMIFVPGHGAPGMMGVPGSEIFKFVAIKTGSGEIEFKHVKFSKPLEIYPKEPDMTHQMEYQFVIVEP
jgi:inhibitor of cysteine peptidase